MDGLVRRAAAAQTTTGRGWLRRDAPQRIDGSAAEAPKYRATQTAAIGMASVAEPARHVGLGVAKADATALTGAGQCPQAPGEAVAVVVAQPSEIREDTVAEQIQTVAGARQLGLAPVQESSARRCLSSPTTTISST
jgi:hypothetical protein